MALDRRGGGHLRRDEVRAAARALAALEVAVRSRGAALALREHVGRPELVLELAAGATPDTAWRQLVQDHPDLDMHRPGLAIAVNRHYGCFEDSLHDEDELAFIPPVAGG